MAFVKKHWFGVAIAALVVVGGSYVGAQAMSAAPKEVTLAQAQQDAPNGPGMKQGKRGLRAGGQRLVHGDLLVQGKDGKLQNVRTDHGVLESVNETTLRIKEADGSTVEVPTSDETRIMRDGEAAKVSDLKAGDNVWTVRVKEEGGEFTTRRVRAVSPERMKELESKRAERREPREKRNEAS